MSIDGLAAAQKAYTDRATNGNFAGIRRATVTAVSPLTISINGVLVTGVPFSPSYDPAVGDVVLVLMDGVAPYVLEQIGTAFGANGRYDQKFTASSTSMGVTNGSGFGTITFPVAFPTTCDGIKLQNNGVGFIALDAIATINGINATVCTFFLAKASTGGGYAAANWAFFVHAWGH